MNLGVTKGEVWSSRNHELFCVTCTQGSVWLTVEGESKDIVLSAGDRYETSARGLIVLEALESALIERSEISA